LKPIIYIAFKELKSYFNSAIAYIFLIVFLITINWFFLKTLFITDSASMNYFFTILPWFFVFLVPAITMKSFAEEERSGTYEVLVTMPLTESQIVIGKFFGSFIFLCLALLLTTPLIFTLSFIGFPDFGPIIGGYIGALLFGGACVTIGIFASSITSNQIVSFILSVSILFLLILIGEPIITYSFPGSLTQILKTFSLKYHFSSISHGVLDIRDFIYYISTIVTFLLLNIFFLKINKKGL